MTRLNLVPAQELTDQHLFAEFREIKMVPKSLRCSLHSRGVAGVLNVLPSAYVLGLGHVSFFYDKGLYLQMRYAALQQELRRRGVAYNAAAQLDPDGVYASLDARFRQDYAPTTAALALVRARIAERIASKPAFYRHNGRPIA